MTFAPAKNGGVRLGATEERSLRDWRKRTGKQRAVVLRCHGEDKESWARQ